MLFLDAAITGTPLAEAPVRTEMEMSLWDLCLKGGAAYDCNRRSFAGMYLHFH